MSAPTTASVSTDISASPEAVYDLVADVTRMGEWSPECVKCEWVDGEPGAVGSRFKGHNKSGFVKWSTTAKVLSADRGQKFSFATMNKDRKGTRWTYTFEGDGAGTKVTESFESLFTPTLIRWAEKLFMRNRQQQLEEGMAKTLAAVKAAAEATA
jgi:uncharacterized protein YndB with AHSA1/START domain